MNAGRRRFLLGSVAGAMCAAYGVAAARPKMFNACRASFPDDPAVVALLERAWTGLDPRQVWDMHVHIAGTGDSGRGIEISSDMTSPLKPVAFAQRLFFLNAGCAGDERKTVDDAYVLRLCNLCDSAPNGFKLLLYAFERPYDEKGRMMDEPASMHIPDAYAEALAAAFPERFEWACSIHPWREDAVPALRAAAARGARAVKWLPPAMNIDPASPCCDTFYEAMAELDLPLITHTGAEKAVHGPGRAEWSNPLRLRRALEHGVRVVAAHCASTGNDTDIDRGRHGPHVPSFDLFARLMDEPRFEHLLFGDISAIIQRNREPELIRMLVERNEWHDRLMFGSDYPLPGVVPLISPRKLVHERLLDEQDVPALERLRHHNPILFDFALKRSLCSRGRQFGASVFETRRHFVKTRMENSVFGSLS